MKVHRINCERPDCYDKKRKQHSKAELIDTWGRRFIYWCRNCCTQFNVLAR